MVCGKPSGKEHNHNNDENTTLSLFKKKHALPWISDRDIGIPKEIIYLLDVIIIVFKQDENRNLIDIGPTIFLFLDTKMHTFLLHLTRQVWCGRKHDEAIKFVGFS